MNKIIIENCKRKIIQLENKIESICSHKTILANILNELNKKTHIRLNNALYGIEIQEEISYLDDWKEFYSKNVNRYKIRLISLEKYAGLVPIEKGTNNIRLLTKTENNSNKKIKEKIKNIVTKKRLIRYFLPLVMLVIIVMGLLLFRPSITGNVVIAKPIIYSESLNLSINQSETYEWKVKNPGEIRSIMAAGSVSGKGTVKIYIEKDGKRYLVYKNK